MRRRRHAAGGRGIAATVLDDLFERGQFRFRKRGASPGAAAVALGADDAAVLELERGAVAVPALEVGGAAGFARVEGFGDEGAAAFLLGGLVLVEGFLEPLFAFLTLDGDVGLESGVQFPPLGWVLWFELAGLPAGYVVFDEIEPDFAILAEEVRGGEFDAAELVWVVEFEEEEADVGIWDVADVVELPDVFEAETLREIEEGRNRHFWWDSMRNAGLEERKQ